MNDSCQQREYCLQSNFGVILISPSLGEKWNFEILQICINHCHLFGIIWHLFIQLEGYRTAKFERLQTSQCWYFIIFVSSPFPRYIFLLRTAQEFSIQNWSTKSLLSFVDSSIKLDSILDSTNAWKLQELQEKKSSNGQLVFFKVLRLHSLPGIEIQKELQEIQQEPWTEFQQLCPGGRKEGHAITQTSFVKYFVPWKED